MALVRHKDKDMARQMENHLAGDLKRRGYTAVTCSDQFEPGAFDGIKEEDAIKKLKSKNIDAVLTIVLLDKKKELIYIHANTNSSPGIYSNRFWGYYSRMQSRIYEPGYYTESTTWFWESNLFDIESKELLYSVQTKSFNPSSTTKLAHEYGQKIVTDMVKQQLIR